MADKRNGPRQAPAALNLTQAFVNTRYGSGRRYHEELDTTERLRAWLTRHHLLTDDVLVTEGDLRHAISAREALRVVLRANTSAMSATTPERRSASADERAIDASLLPSATTPSTSVISTRDPTAASADVLNTIAAYAPVSIRFHADGQTSLVPATNGVEGALTRLLAVVPLAQAEGSWRWLKICRNDACGRAFYDTSKNHSGAWCDLGKCGNRLNARAARARRHLGQ